MKFKSALIATMAATTAITSIAPLNVSAGTENNEISEKETNFINSYKTPVNIGGDITVKFNAGEETVNGQALPANTFVVSGTGTLDKDKFTCYNANGFLAKFRENIEKPENYTVYIDKGLKLPEKADVFFSLFDTSKLDSSGTISPSSDDVNSKQYNLIIHKDFNVSNCTSMRGLFSKIDNITADTSNWDTSKVTDMSFMFYRSKNANLDTSNWDTSKVTNLREIFAHTDKANPDVSNWDTSKVTNMIGVFFYAYGANPDVANWDTSSVTDLSSTFRYTKLANPDVSNWDTSKVYTMYYMFGNSKIANPDVSNWDTSNVTGMVGVFKGTDVANPDVSNWDTSKVTDMREMFYESKKANPDISKWDTSKVTNMNYIFKDAESAVNLDLSKCNFSRQDDSYHFEYINNKNPGTIKSNLKFFKDNSKFIELKPNRPYKIYKMDSSELGNNNFETTESQLVKTMLDTGKVYTDAKKLAKDLDTYFNGLSGSDGDLYVIKPEPSIAESTDLTTKKIEIHKNDPIPDLETYKENITGLPEDAEVSITTNIDNTTSLGEKTAKINVTYSDGTFTLLDMKVEVKDRVPWTDIIPVPVLTQKNDLEIHKGDPAPDVEAYKEEIDGLPDETEIKSIEIVQEIDSEKLGNQIAKVKVSMKNGMSVTVEMNVFVKDRIPWIEIEEIPEVLAKEQIIIFKGETPDYLANLKGLPEDAEVEIVQDIDNSESGLQEAKLKIKFASGASSIITMKVDVREKESDLFVPELKKLSVKQDKEIDITTALKNVPEGATVTVKKDVNTEEAEKQTGIITVHFKDGTEKDIEVVVDVKAKKVHSRTSNSENGGFNSSHNTGRTEENNREESKPSKAVVKRFSGKNRVETSLETAKALDGTEVVIASADKYADSLSAGNLVSRYGAKLILVSGDTDISKIMPEGTTKVYIIGGENSVSSDIEKAAKEKVKNVIRLGGKNRYETNENVLAASKYSEVGVADGRNFADALAASPISVKKNIGLKLVDGSKEYSSKQKVVYTYGGKNSIKQDGGTRISGEDRYSTNMAINRELGEIANVTLADGRNFPDALSAINLVKAYGGSVLLTKPEMNSADRDYIRDMSNVYVVGGNASISQETIDYLLNK